MAVPYTASSGTTDVSISTSSVTRLMGWCVSESATTAAAAEVILRAGSDANGQPVAVIPLGSDGNNTQWLGPQGIVCNGGLFLDRVTGTSTVVLYLE